MPAKSVYRTKSVLILSKVTIMEALVDWNSTLVVAEVEIRNFEALHAVCHLNPIPQDCTIDVRTYVVWVLKSMAFNAFNYIKHLKNFKHDSQFTWSVFLLFNNLDTWYVYHWWLNAHIVWSLFHGPMQPPWSQSVNVICLLSGICSCEVDET